MKKNMRLFLILYLAGFGMGVLAGNLFLRKTGYQTSLLSVYLSSGPDLEAAQFFGELFFQRGKLFFLGAVCGVTILGMFLVAGGLLWAGFLGGNLAVLFLTQWGIQGLGTGILCLFPQILFYIPGWLLYFFAVLQMSRKSMGGSKRTREDYKAYFFFLSMAGVLLLLGIWSESYVNQKILAWIIENHL